MSRPVISNLESLKENIQTIKLGEFFKYFIGDTFVTKAKVKDQLDLACLWVQNHDFVYDDLYSIFLYNQTISKFTPHEKAELISAWLTTNNPELGDLIDLVQSNKIDDLNDNLLIFEKWAQNPKNAFEGNNLKTFLQNDELFLQAPVERIKAILSNFEIEEEPQTRRSESRNSLDELMQGTAFSDEQESKITEARAAAKNSSNPSSPSRASSTPKSPKDFEAERNFEQFRNLYDEIKDSEELNETDFLEIFDKEPIIKKASFTNKLDLFAIWHTNPKNNIRFVNLISLIAKHFQTDAIDPENKKSQSLDKIAMIHSWFTKAENPNSTSYEELIDTIYDFRNGILHAGQVKDEEVGTLRKIKQNILSAIKELISAFLTKESKNLPFEKLIEILKTNPTAYKFDFSEQFKKIIEWARESQTEITEGNIESLFVEDGLFSMHAQDFQNMIRRTITSEVNAKKERLTAQNQEPSAREVSPEDVSGLKTKEIDATKTNA